MTRSLRLVLGLLVFAPLFGARPAIAEPTSGKQGAGHQTAPAACYGSTNATTPASTGIAPSLVTPGGVKKRSPSCFIAVDAAMKEVAHRRALLIDVRDAAAFEQFRIPGSLNLPLHAVKTKPFLKTNALVLVDEGQSPSELQAACLNLKKSGFTKVAVLKGGLKAWRDHDGRLEGQALEQDKLNTISPAQLFKEAAYDDWLILSVAAVKKTELRKLLPHAEPLGAAHQKMALTARVKAVAANRKLPVSHLNVVVVDDNGSQQERINAIAKRQDLKNVLYLDGGLQGYREFLKSQTAVWHRIDNPPRQQACRG